MIKDAHVNFRSNLQRLSKMQLNWHYRMTISCCVRPSFYCVSADDNAAPSLVHPPSPSPHGHDRFFWGRRITLRWIEIPIEWNKPRPIVKKRFDGTVWTLNLVIHILAILFCLCGANVIANSTKCFWVIISVF